MSRIYEDLVDKFRSLQCNFKNVLEENKTNEVALTIENFPHCNLNTSKDSLLKCAVLVILFRFRYRFHILLTIRSFKMNSFPGELCFPGGKFDENFDRTFEDTALREAEEEINLKKDNVKVICQLCPFVSPIGHYIVPVLCILKHSNEQANDKFEDTMEVVKNLSHNPDEVESIFWVPFDYFLDYEKLPERIHRLPSSYHLDKSLISFVEQFKLNKQNFARVLINFEDELFVNNVKPNTSFLYGINATILMLTISTVEPDLWSHLKASLQFSVDRVEDYAQAIRFISYILYLDNLIKKSNKIKSKM